MQCPKPQTLEKVGRNLSLVGLIVMLCVLPSEKHVATAYQGAQVLVILGFVLRLIGHMRWRFWAVAVAVWAVSMTAFLFIGEMSVHTKDDLGVTLLDIGEGLLIEVGALAFCMVLVFLSQFFYRPEVWGFLDRWMKTILALAWAFCLVVMISAVWSIDPFESFRYLRKFLVPYLLVYMITVETLHSWRHYRIVITTIFLVGIIVTSISVMGRYIYRYSGHDVQREFLEGDNKGFLREEVIGGKVELRNQWPFEHHNRLCAYALMVTLFVWLQFFVTRNWELRTLVAISTLVPFWCMLATLTRGGWVALAAGAIALILMLNWRVIWVLLAIVVATWCLAPPVIRGRIKTVFDPRTYTSSVGTFKDRWDTWGWTVDILKQRPVLGLGAGWEVFGSYVKVHYGSLREGVDPPHAHNNFLEIAVESGLLALLLFLAFLAALTAQIARAWRETQRRTKRRCVTAGFFGLLVGITVYGLSNYSLRYHIGMLIWVCFALMTLLPTIARAIPEDDESPAPTPPEATAA